MESVNLNAIYILYSVEKFMIVLLTRY